MKIILSRGIHTNISLEHSQKGHGLLYRYQEQNFADLLRKCAECKSLSEGRDVHSELARGGHDRGTFLGNLLVQMYGCCGSMDDARKTFDQITQQNIYSWNIIIAAYAANGQVEESKAMFESMSERNVVSWTSMFSAIAKIGRLPEARMIFDRMPDWNQVSWNAMITAYARNGHMVEARELFHQSPATSITTRNCMISGYGDNGQVQQAKDFFDVMEIRDTFSWHSIINALCKNACMEEARALFDEMEEKSVISWNTVISGYAQNGHAKDALELLRLMDLDGIDPTPQTLSSIMDACASLTSISQGKIIHEHIKDAGFLNYDDVALENAIVNMYGKCGSVVLARKSFDAIRERDAVSWTAMMAAYAHNGLCEEALKLFRTMLVDGVQPTSVTLITALSACSHGGLFDDGCDCFGSLIKGDYKIIADAGHFLCIADLFGRCGQLDAAEKLLLRMPFDAGEVAWTSLLNACKIHGDAKRASRVAKRTIGCMDDKDDPAPYVLLSNIYAAGGKRKQEKETRKEMREKCGKKKKQPGLSTITIKGKVHEFMANDRNHPKKEEIYVELERLSELMKTGGYMHDNAKAVEEKEKLMCYHSEKLAVGFGLISIPAHAPLSIFKNIRVCFDCHTAIKFISAITQRNIAVRDPSRFHHFHNGSCSCKDYW